MRFSMLLFLLVAGAATADGPVRRSDHMEICKLKSDIASLVMEERQNGTSMAEAMGVAASNSYHQTLVQIAYQVPRQSTEEMRQVAITEFSNKVFAACFEHIPDDAR